MENRKSPYVSNPNRLGDVIAAIQATGTYKFYKLSAEQWAYRISADVSKKDYWKEVFLQHPEFFRFDSDGEKICLVVRRQRIRRYNVDDDTVWSADQYNDFSGDKSTRFSREPLSQSEITALINVAISLHARALEQERETRWWYAPLLGFMGALSGALIGAAAKAVWP